MTNDNKADLKAHHEAHNHKQVGKLGLLLRFIIFIAWVAIIGLFISLITCQPVQAKQIATNTNNGYYIDLSKLNSDMPSRTLLAFFVPDNSPASQAVTIRSSTILRAHLSDSREYSLISKVNTSPTDYDGLTLQNKIAERRICRAVSVKTESKTRHPILLPYSVAFTQNLTGVIHHG